MQVDAKTGWLDGVAVCASPYYGSRPPGVSPSLLVIHGISLPAGQFGGPYIKALFTGALDTHGDPRFHDLAGLRVSAHLLVDRLGHVTQFVSLAERAWHAGKSVFQGQVECNDFSIGVELEGSDITPYTDAQYHTLGWLVPVLRAAYPAITAQRVVGHCHIAPGRKTDPGDSFDWWRLAQMTGITPPLGTGEGR